MAFNLIAEANCPLDWGKLLAGIRPVPVGVECFPIPASVAGEPDALGVSLLTADEATWAGFVALADVLRAGCGMRVFELYLGTEVTPGSLAAVRRLFLG